MQRLIKKKQTFDNYLFKIQYYYINTILLY